MSYDRLWAPWRLAYIADKEQKTIGGEPALALRTPRQPPPGACFLCHYLAEDAAFDRDNFVLRRADRTVVVLNRYPYNNGHLLVAPKVHKAALGDLDHDELLECQTLLVELTALLERAFKAQGFNIGLNLGAIAGAGLPGHLHWHLVPRWLGDTNFMPVVAATHILPQALEAAYDILLAAWNE